MNYLEMFRFAIDASGMVAPDEIVGDGRLHRFSPTGKKRDDAGWYVLHLDKVPTGVFGNWRDGLQQRWCIKADGELTPSERQALRERAAASQRLRDQECQRRQVIAAKRSADLWAAGVQPTGHPYLVAKRVSSYGLRVGSWEKFDAESGETELLSNVLYVPMRDTAGALWSLQGITEQGRKLFLPGGRVKGCYHSIGRPSGKIVIAEGYATAATIHSEAAHPVAVAFNAVNLLPVSQALRAKYPCLTIVLAADDDWKTVGNPGVTHAMEAARRIGGLLAKPNFDGLPRGQKDTDFNDLHRLAGTIEVSA